MSVNNNLTTRVDLSPSIQEKDALNAEEDFGWLNSYIVSANQTEAPPPITQEIIDLSPPEPKRLKVSHGESTDADKTLFTELDIETTTNSPANLSLNNAWDSIYKAYFSDFNTDNKIAEAQKYFDNAIGEMEINEGKVSQSAASALEKASNLALEILDKEKSSKEPLNLLAEINFLKGDFETSVSYFEQIIALDPEAISISYIFSLLKVANSHLKHNQIKLGFAIYDKANDLYEKNGFLFNSEQKIAIVKEKSCFMQSSVQNITNPRKKRKV